MFTKGFSRWFFITSLAGTLFLLAASLVPVHALSPTFLPEPKCVSCHEDLYFLHDTGKWFCLRETEPMTCVGCHGGDGTAITKDAAHANRVVHPIINADISKCMQCHPEQGVERVGLFSQEAGISPVRVSQPYTPEYVVDAEFIPVTGNTRSTSLFPELAFLIMSLSVASLLIIFILFRLYRTMTSSS